MRVADFSAIEIKFKGRFQKDLYIDALTLASEKSLVVIETKTSIDGNLFILWTRMVPREDMN